MKVLNLLVVLALYPFSSSAQNLDEVNLEDLLNIEVTTATKKSIKVEDAPGSVTVISRQQILDTNARTMRDVLNIFIPGLDVVPTYFRYGDRVSEGIYSRGLLSDFSQQVLFLHNGMGKYNETTFSSSYPAIEFTLENIERIEISRTPIPLYGGSAITTINIITRDQYIANGVEFFVDFGANDEVSLASNPLGRRRYTSIFGKPVGKEWKVSGHVQTYSDYGQEHGSADHDGGFALDPSLLRDGTKSAMNGTLNFKSVDEKWFIQTNYKEINRDNFMAGTTPSSRLGMYNYGGSSFIGNAKYKPSSKTEIIAGMMRSSFENVVDFGGLPYGGEIKNYDLFLEANTNYEFEGGGNHSVLVGGKIENEGQIDGTAYIWNGTTFDSSKSESALFAPNISRMVYSLFAEDTWKSSESTSFVIGGRFDRYVGFGDSRYNIFNPRVAGNLAISDRLSIKGVYASASRPPSIYEKMGVNLNPLFGNSGNASGLGYLGDIKPESVQTFELSALYKDKSYKVKLTPFYQIFRDKIEFAPTTVDLNASGTADDLQAINNGNAKVMGVDLDVWFYQTKKTYYFINGTYLKSHDDASDETTLFLPSIYVNGGININHKRWTGNLTAFYRGKRELGGQTINKSDAMYNANLNLNYQWTKALVVYSLIENITDKENIVPLVFDGYGVPMRGRTYHIGLRYTM